MKIWLFCICRDESPIMTYFIRHYEQFCDKLIFYDDQSTDGTREIITSCPKSELRDWPGEHGIVDDDFMDFANEQWKEARGQADWVIWVDADEFVYHSELESVLKGYMEDGIHHPSLCAYTMVSDSFPTTNGQIYDEVKTGFRDTYWDKHAIFRGDIRYNVGRHSVDKGNFQYRPSPTQIIKLLHFRCLGMDYLKARHTRNWGRVPQRCRNFSYGANCAPGFEGHHGIVWFEQQMKLPRENVI